MTSVSLTARCGRAATVALLTACLTVPGLAAEGNTTAAKLDAVLHSGTGKVEVLLFGDRTRAPVRVVRGPSLPPTPPVPARTTEIASFGSGFADRVTIVRGGPGAIAITAGRPLLGNPHVEKIALAAPAQSAVLILRGPVAEPPPASFDLFEPASIGELDRIAFAVDGIESHHGADPRMWRPDPNGPQGPMQVSAAAAGDVGGGDRFDLRQNRLLGRAYLAQMFRRYGNWRDALAAYNWGPGNVDQWIAAGRDPDRLPPGVAYYVTRALRNALMAVAEYF